MSNQRSLLDEYWGKAPEPSPGESVKEDLALQRQVLKARLWKERKKEAFSWPHYTIRPWLAQPICPYCGATIERPDDAVMHEVFIKRSDLPIKMQHLIMHEYNCVLAHHWPCHSRWGNTDEFKRKCADQLFRLYGRDAIVAWVGGLGLKQHVEIPEE
jgi:hypothetical protein